MRRRELLAITAAAPLAACGFHPMYAARGPGTATSSLPAIYVDRIPERAGQLLRQALQRRFDGPQADTRRFELSVNFGVAGEGTGYELDNAITRQRMTGIADWSLKRFPEGTVIATGHARALDGYDVTFEEYFAAQLASENATRRLAENVADGITQQVAAYFETHKQG